MTIARKFLIGSVGVVTLLSGSAVAVFADNGSSSSSSSLTGTPTACSAALDAQLAVQSPASDTLHAAEKSARDTYVTAVKAALLLTDTAQREAALKTARQNLETALSAAMTQYQSAVKTVNETVRTSCAGLGIGGGRGSFSGKMMEGSLEKEMMGKRVGMNHSWKSKSSTSSSQQ